MAADSLNLLAAKFRAPSLKIKGVMASDPKWRAKCLELVRKMSFPVVGALTVLYSTVQNATKFETAVSGQVPLQTN